MDYLFYERRHLHITFEDTWPCLVLSKLTSSGWGSNFSHVFACLPFNYCQTNTTCLVLQKCFVLMLSGVVNTKTSCSCLSGISWYFGICLSPLAHFVIYKLSMFSKGLFFKLQSVSLYWKCIDASLYPALFIIQVHFKMSYLRGI